jgi:MerR family transcriptional regulator, light-induced transcriptional regulator
MAISSESDLLARRRQIAASARARLDPTLVAPDPSERLGMVFDLEMHLAFLGAAVRCDSITLFTGYAVWTRDLLVSTGSDHRPLLACLEAVEAELVRQGRGAWLGRAQQCLTAARDAMASPTAATGTHLAPGAPHHALAAGFMDACLGLRRDDALAMIHAAVDNGVPVRDIYIDVITPVLHELGRLWHRNQISIGQEHYCTAVAQMVMSQLFPVIFDKDRGSGRLVSTCVAGELHEIGARMLTDLFEMQGWDTVFLGADVPNDSVIDMLVERDAQVLAISATLGASLGEVAGLIRDIRATPSCAGVKIMVGGAAFNADERIWQQIGADGWAPDVDTALALAAGWRT